MRVGARATSLPDAVLRPLSRAEGSVQMNKSVSRKRVAPCTLCRLAVSERFCALLLTAKHPN